MKTRSSLRSLATQGSISNVTSLIRDAKTMQQGSKRKAGLISSAQPALCRLLYHRAPSEV